MKKLKKVADFKDRFKFALKAREKTQAEISKKTEIDKASISYYLKGNYEPKNDKLYLIANALKVSPEWLMGYDTDMEEHPIYKGVSLEDIIDEDDEFEKIPLLGEVAAGVPIYMDDDLNDYITVDKKYIQSGYDYFCITIRGDSMYPILMNKDIVLVRSQSTCNSNDIAIVSVDNETATAKYVYKHKDKLELRPANPNYIPLVFPKDEVNTRIRIIGVVTNLLDRKL